MAKKNTSLGSLEHSGSHGLALGGETASSIKSLQETIAEETLLRQEMDKAADAQDLRNTQARLERKKAAINAEYAYRRKKEKETEKALAEAQKNEDKAEIKRLEDKLKKEKDLKDKAFKKSQREIALKDSKEIAKGLSDSIFGKGNTLSERLTAVKNLNNGRDGLAGFLSGVYNVANMSSNFVQQINNDIENIAKKKGIIDTALQGSKHKTVGGLFGMGGSYWDNISSTLTGITGLSPLIRQEAIAANVEQFAKSGAAFNIEQRAFLATISDKIAATFNAFDGGLARLIRIQQQDSTAARLGMESSMTAFLNNMFETSEFMKDAATTVKGALAEAEALMGTEAAVAFEYQVQKWLGSAYSVGMGSSSVGNLANSLGRLAAGDISALTSGGTSNLLLMAASRAGLPLTEMLASGLDESNTNTLMEAVVNYLADIYEDNKTNRVIQQQMAGVFGLTASDLKAAANLASSNKDISKYSLSYAGAVGRLQSMSNSLYSRTSIGELGENVFANLKYSTAAGIANSPVLYGIYKAANMLKDLTGGIALPFVSALGTGVDLNTTVADLMLTGALGGSILGNVGKMAMSGGLFSGFSGSGMLNALKITTGGRAGITSVQRGSGAVGGATISGASTSTSGFIGNASGDDVYNSSMSGAADTKDAALAQAKEEDNGVDINIVNENIVKIYTLLNNVTLGTQSLSVSVSNYGLTGMAAQS